MSFKLLIRNDNIIEAQNVLNTVTGSNINNASAIITISLAATSASIAGESWPLTMAYVTASSGKYRATLKNTLSVTENKKYIGTLLIDAGNGLRGEWTVPIIARDRRPPN